MGMYTELDLNIRFNVRDISQQDLAIIRAIGNPDLYSEPKEVPDNNFFKEEGWAYNLRGHSSYFIAHCRVELEEKEDYNEVALSIRSNFKNYKGHLENFLDWVLPLTSNFKGEFLGYYRYEEYIKPTLIYKDIPRDYQIETDEEVAHNFESPECEF